MAPTVRFALLGPLRAWSGREELNLGNAKQTAVLTVLLMGAGSPVTLASLVDAVWGDDPPRTAPGTIRTYVYRLRRALTAGDQPLIRSARGGYVLSAEHAASDLSEFRELAARGRAARGDGDLTLAAASLSEGLALWRGESLAGVPGPYAQVQRAGLTELRLTAAEEHLTCLMELGRPAEAAAGLAALVAEHPLRERFRELHMLALYASGRQAEALEVYHQTRDLLREELGVSPAPHLQEAFRRILAADPGLPALPVAAAAEPGPHVPRGPEPAFTPLVRPAQLPADLPHFTGRGQEMRQLASRLLTGEGSPATPAVGLIVGMAGVGKTSLAVRWAHQVAGRFPDGQLHVNLQGFDGGGRPRHPAIVQQDVLRALGIRAADIPPDHENRAALYRSVLAGQRILLLLDNARDSRQARALVPGAAGCLVIVTSRRQLPGLVATHQAQPLRLGVLGVAEARALLVSVLGRPRVEAEPDAVREIIALCGQLPVALANIAAQAACESGRPLAAIAGSLRRAHGTLDGFSPGDDPVIDPRAVFGTSYRDLSLDAASFFRLLSRGDGPDLSVASAARLAGLDQRRASALLIELSREHLLIRRDEHHYRWPPLIRAYAAELNGDQDPEPTPFKVPGRLDRPAWPEPEPAGAPRLRKALARG